MLRQLAARRFRAVFASQMQCSPSVGTAGARELSGQDCHQPAASFALYNGRPQICTEARTDRQLLQYLSPKSTPRLEIWRQFATSATAAIAHRPAVFVASVTTGKKSSTTAKKKPPSASGSRKAKSSAASKAKTARSKKAGTSRTSGTARGRAAAERRRVSAVAKVKARAAESIAKVKAREKALAEKLKAEIKARANLIAKVKADQKEKFKIALEKVKAKAAEKIALLESKSKTGGRVKRAPSAYNLYLSEQMKANSKLTFKEASQRFKELPGGEKKKYEDQAAAAKAEAQQAREKLATERAARRPRNAFMFFYAEQRPVVLAANPGLSAVDITKRVGEMWRGMTAVERQKYTELSAADRKAKGLVEVPAVSGAATAAMAAVPTQA